MCMFIYGKERNKQKIRMGAPSMGPVDLYLAEARKAVLSCLEMVQRNELSFDRSARWILFLCGKR